MLNLAVVNPVEVLGDLMQPSMNTSTLHILKYLRGKPCTSRAEDAVEAPGAGGWRVALCLRREEAPR